MSATVIYSCTHSSLSNCHLLLCQPLSFIPERILLSATVTYSYVSHCHLFLYAFISQPLSAAPIFCQPLSLFLYVLFSQPLSLTPIFCLPLSLIPVRILLSATVTYSYVSHCHLFLYAFFSQPLSLTPMSATVIYSCTHSSLSHCHLLLCQPLSFIPVRILLSTAVSCSYILSAIVTYSCTYYSLNHCHLLLYSVSCSYM